MYKKFVFGLFILSFFICSPIFSEVPNKINYQGVLKEGGELVNGTRTMKFSIYDAATGGNLKWTSGDVNVTVNGGTFRYVLSPTGIDWGTGGPYYLQLTIGGQVLLPREEIGSSIYSLYSGTASVALSVDWSNIKNIPNTFGAADNLGNHTATTTLKMGNYAIIISSSIEGVSKIIWADGTVQVSSPTAGADNLGNHTATQNLNMANNDIINVNKVNGYNITQQFSDIAASTNTLENTKLDKSSATITYLFKTEKAADADKLDGLDSTAFVQTTGGSMSGQLNLNNYALIISSSIVGVTKIEWADGTVQVSSPTAGADNLGNHTATQDLDMATYGITNVSTITASGGGLLFSGTAGGLLASGAGTRLMWYPKKSAFRAGYVSGTQWDDGNIGNYSIAMGESTIASNWYSTAMGDATIASGFSSTAMGDTTKASGNFSTAMGSRTTASGQYSTAMGNNTNASGFSSTSMGDQTTASGNASTSMGEQTTASGDYSIAMGQYVTAGPASNTIAIGNGINDTNPLVNNTANSLMVGFNRTTPTLFVSSSSVGIDNTSMTPGLNVSTINYVSRIVWADGTVQVSSPTAGADNLGNHTATQDLNMSNFGITNVSTITASGGGLLFDGNVGSILKQGAGTRLMWYPKKSAFRAGYVSGTNWDDANIGYYSIAMGNDTKASGNYSTAMGYGATASGSSSFAVGNGANVSGSDSIAMGWGTSAGGQYAVSIGRSTTANANYGIAMGYGAIASGEGSTAIGQYVTASAQNSIAIGKGIDNINRLVNDTANSFMVGFNRTTPTLTVTSYSVTMDGMVADSENILELYNDGSKVTRFTGTGDAYSNGTWNSGGADYAEWFEKEEEIKPGDIVGLNLDTGKARKYQSGDVLLGICSSNPGFVGNSNINKSDEEMKKNYVLVGLVGQLDFNKEQVMITGRKIQTKDGKQIGYLLANGKVLLKMQ